ncbi:MAG: hypothetical protein ABFD81_06790 [Syntrophaceae bacterium]
MSGLIKELLSKPTLKDILRGHLRNISESGGREMVKDLIWQDFEVLFSIMGAIPSMINACVGGMTQLVEDIHAKFSPRLLKGYIGSVLADVDRSVLKSCGNAVSSLARDVLAESPELKPFVLEQGPIAIAKVINAGTAGLNTLCRQDPDLLSAFLSRVIDNLDKPALNDAALNLVDAVLDQKLGILSLAGGLVKRRSAKLFKRFGLGS